MILESGESGTTVDRNQTDDLRTDSTKMIKRNTLHWIPMMSVVLYNADDENILDSKLMNLNYFPSLSEYTNKNIYIPIFWIRHLF